MRRHRPQCSGCPPSTRTAAAQMRSAHVLTSPRPCMSHTPTKNATESRWDKHQSQLWTIWTAQVPETIGRRGADFVENDILARPYVLGGTLFSLADRICRRVQLDCGGRVRDGGSSPRSPSSSEHDRADMSVAGINRQKACYDRGPAPTLGSVPTARQ